MGLWDPYAPAAKGPVTKSLDKMSVGSNLYSEGKHARDLMVALKTAIEKLGKGKPEFEGLENVLGEHLLNYDYKGEELTNIKEYLKTCWFSDSGWWPHFQPLAEIYGKGLIRALEESLNTPAGQLPIPIESYWIVGHTTVEVVTLVNQRQVTLLIATPFPLNPSPIGIEGVPFDAYCTARRAGTVPNEIPPRLPGPVPGLRVVTYKLKSKQP